MDSNNEVNTISSIQPQLSNLLSPSLLEQTEVEETVGHVSTMIQLIQAHLQLVGMHLFTFFTSEMV